MFGEQICSVVLRELLDVRVAPLHSEGPVQPASAVVELLRLDDICAPLEDFLSTQFTILHVLMMCFNLSLSFSAMRMFSL